MYYGFWYTRCTLSNVYAYYYCTARPACDARTSQSITELGACALVQYVICASRIAHIVCIRPTTKAAICCRAEGRPFRDNHACYYARAHRAHIIHTIIPLVISTVRICPAGGVYACAKVNLGHWCVCVYGLCVCVYYMRTRAHIRYH